MLKKLYAGALATAVLFGAAGCSDDDDNNGPTPENNFTADLTGANITPTPVTTTATGNATLTLSDAGSTIAYTINVTDLTDAQAAFLYTGSTTDVPGTPVAVLLAAPMTGPLTGQLSTGTLTATDIGGGETYTSLAEKIRAGNAFIVVQTIANPTGELRGQLEVAP
jgi:hypothetical protein